MAHTQREAHIEQFKVLLALVEQSLRTKKASQMFYFGNLQRVNQDIAELQAEVDSIKLQIKELENDE